MTLADALTALWRAGAFDAEPGPVRHAWAYVDGLQRAGTLEAEVAQQAHQRADQHRRLPGHLGVMCARTVYTASGPRGVLPACSDVAAALVAEAGAMRREAL